LLTAGPVAGVFLWIEEGLMNTINAIKSGRWLDPATWDGGNIPRPGDIVRLGDNTVTVDQDIDCPDLTIYANGSGCVEITESCTFNGGEARLTPDSTCRAIFYYSQPGKIVRLGFRIDTTKRWNVNSTGPLGGSGASKPCWH
jgi:hypothetical protein